MCLLFPQIQLKWMAWWSDLHNQLHGAGYCLEPEFHTRSHYISRGVDRPLYCVTIFMEKEVLNLQRHSWTGNVFTRQRKMQCSQETTHKQMQQRWVRRNAVWAQHHSLSRRMSLHAASRAGAACVCALALRVYAQGCTRHCKSPARCAGTRFSSMPALSSVQAWAK